MQTKLILLTLVLFAGLSSRSQISVGFTVDPNAPKFKFEDKVLDYGIIEQGSNNQREFKFTNIGKEPLVISSVHTNCGCMTASWPKEPIMPGKSDVIKIKYDTNRIGKISKGFCINSNAETPSITIKVIGLVIEPAKVDTSSIKIPRSDN